MNKHTTYNVIFDIILFIGGVHDITIKYLKEDIWNKGETIDKRDHREIEFLSNCRE